MRLVVLDTAIIIDHLRQPEKSCFYEKLAERKGIKLLLPAVVLTELYVGESAAKKSQEEKISQLLQEIVFIPADEEISKTAGILMRGYRTLNLADSLVAATAISKKARLCTFNESHFAPLDGLKLYPIGFPKLSR